MATLWPPCPLVPQACHGGGGAGERLCSPRGADAGRPGPRWAMEAPRPGLARAPTELKCPERAAGPGLALGADPASTRIRQVTSQPTAVSPAPSCEHWQEAVCAVHRGPRRPHRTTSSQQRSPGSCRTSGGVMGLSQACPTQTRACHCPASPRARVPPGRPGSLLGVEQDWNLSTAHLPQGPGRFRPLLAAGRGHSGAPRHLRPQLSGTCVSHRT